MRKRKPKTQKTKIQYETIFLILGTVLGAFMLWSVLKSHVMQTPENQIQEGAALFKENCAECHGPQAVGEDPSQPKGGLKADGTYLAPALNGTGHAWHHPNEGLFYTIKNGSPAKGSSMKGFAGQLSDKEIHSIIEFFKSLWPEKIRQMHSRNLHHKK